MRWRIFAFYTLAMLFLTSREPPWADAHVVYDTTQNLVDHMQLDVRLAGGSPWFYVVRDGRRYGVFPLGNVVAMVPSYLAYKALRLIPSLPDKPLQAFCAHLSPTMCMAGACALFFTLLRRRGVGERWALWATLALGFGTMSFVYARAPYSEALQTLLVLWGVERALDQGEAPTLAGIGWLGVAMGTLVNAKLVNVLLVPPVVAYVMWQQRRALPALVARSWLGVVAFGEFVAVALWHNHWKTGSWLDSGYQIREGIFSGDLFAALHGLLLSSGKGLFWYAPPLVLGLLGVATAWRRERAQTALVLSIIAVVVLFNAKFRHWHADYCWGPRHLVALGPLVLWCAVPWLPEAMARGRLRLRRAALGTLLAAGIAVQILGASLYWDHYIRVLIAVKDQTGAPGWFGENLAHGHYIPSFSPLFGQAWLLKHQVMNDENLDADAPWKPIIAAPADLKDAWGRLRFDWWALDWFDARTQRPEVSALVLATLLGAGAGGFGFSLRASARASRSGRRAAAAPGRRAG